MSKKVLVRQEDNVIFDFGNDIIFAKPGAEDGGLMPCTETEATHIWNREKNIACMADVKISGIKMIEVEDIPEYVETEKYKYVDGAFVENENYVEYHSEQDRISALEDMVNMLLLGGM